MMVTPTGLFMLISFFIVVDVRWTSANIGLSVVEALLLAASLLLGPFAILICYLRSRSREASLYMFINVYKTLYIYIYVCLFQDQEYKILLRFVPVM